MAVLSGSGSPQIALTGGLSPVSTPTIYNLTLTNAATEYNLPVPAGTKRVQITNRENKTMFLAYVAGGTTTSWLTIPAGTSYSEVDLAVTTLTLYIQAPTASSTVAEIIVWA